MRKHDRHEADAVGPPPASRAAPAPSSLEALAARAGNAAFSAMVTPTSDAAIARTVLVRPRPDAASRVPDFMRSLNAQSPATRYTLSGDRLEAAPVPGQRAANFDRRMRRFIDGRTTVRLDLVRRSHRVAGATVDGDDFNSGTVDVDDLLSSSNESFRQILIHFITERRAVRDHAGRTAGGGGFRDAEFDRGHRAGLAAELDHIRRELHDWTITGGESPGGNRRYRSRLGYSITHTLVDNGDLLSGDVLVTRRDGTTVGFDAFRAERQREREERARRRRRHQ